jgi:hypothetical protein
LLLPAAARYFIFLFFVFALAKRKNEKSLEEKNRSAEGYCATASWRVKEDYVSA